MEISASFSVFFCEYIISGIISAKLLKKLGRALTAIDFEYKMINGIRRYHVVCRSTSEIQLHRHDEESVEVF